MAAVQALEAEPWCLAAGICYPQPWMNLKDLASAVVISVDSTHPDAVTKAEAAATELADALFAAREQFMPIPDSIVEFDEAVARAFSHQEAKLASEVELVVIGDGVDSTNAGAPGDSNHLLSELLKYKWPGSGAMCPMVSPSAVAAAEVASAVKT